MIIVRALLLVICAGLAVPAAEQSPTYFVDLTTARRTDAEPAASLPRNERLTMPGVVAPHDVLLPFGYLSVTLDSFDSASYRDGTPYVGEVTITNTGSRPLSFPIAVDNAQIAMKDDGAVAASVMLQFDDELLGRNFHSIAQLYGATAKPDTVVMLKPRESLRIRGLGLWWTRARARPEDFPAWSERTVQVRAAVELRPYGRRYAPVLSSNQLPIVLRAR